MTLRYVYINQWLQIDAMPCRLKINFHELSYLGQWRLLLGTSMAVTRCEVVINTNVHRGYNIIQMYESP
jgi:hypothetical protein